MYERNRSSGSLRERIAKACQRTRCTMLHVVFDAYHVAACHVSHGWYGRRYRKPESTGDRNELFTFAQHLAHRCFAGGCYLVQPEHIFQVGCDLAQSSEGRLLASRSLGHVGVWVDGRTTGGQPRASGVGRDREVVQRLICPRRV